MWIVNIHTDDFDARAIHPFEFPWSRITELQMRPNPEIAIDLLHDALLDPEDALRLEALSYRQLVKVLDAYLSAKPVESNISALAVNNFEAET